MHMLTFFFQNFVQLIRIFSSLFSNEFFYAKSHNSINRRKKFNKNMQQGSNEGTKEENFFLKELSISFSSPFYYSCSFSSVFQHTKVRIMFLINLPFLCNSTSQESGILGRRYGVQLCRTSNSKIKPKTCHT